MIPMEGIGTERKLRRDRIVTRLHGTSHDQGVLDTLIRNIRLGFAIVEALVADKTYLSRPAVQ